MAAPQPDLNAILAALGTLLDADGNLIYNANPPQGRQTPTQNSAPSQPPQTYPSAATPSNPLAGLALPTPTNYGNLDLSSIKPVSTGNVSLADAIAKAKGMAAERATARDSTRSVRRSRSRSPQRAGANSYRDNYNPFRDERRDGQRGTNGRERSVTPPMKSPPHASQPQMRTRSPPFVPIVLEDNTEIITVSSSSVGLIIGRGGENLRRVESQTGARVQFITGPEGSGPLRKCRLTGTKRERDDARQDIENIIKDHPTEQPAKQITPKPDAYVSAFYETETTQQNGDKNIQMMVPDKTVGLIIGRGGETIRDIQERSGCHVNITSENKSINGLRPVNLIGSRQATDEARKLINDVVESDTRAGPQHQQPPQHNQYPHYPPPHTPYTPYPVPAPSYGMPYPEPFAQPPPRQAPYDPHAGSRATDTITVPSEAVGMIIGKGGETIKEMQNVTGCKINVAPPAHGPDITREIGLIGSHNSIDQAKRAVWDKVNAVVRFFRQILLMLLSPY